MSKEIYARKSGQYDKVRNILPDGSVETNEDGSIKWFPAYSVVSRKSGLIKRDLMENEAREMAARLNVNAEIVAASEARNKAERESLALAEENRRASLTDEERQREDDEKELSYQNFSMEHRNLDMLRNVESIASALEAAAKDVREISERYQKQSDEYKYMNAEALVRQIMDVTYFLPQHLRERYVVSSSYEVIQSREKARELADKLGLPAEAAYPKRKQAEEPKTVAETYKARYDVEDAMVAEGFFDEFEVKS